MNKIISRRDILKGIALTAGGAFLTACGAQANPGRPSRCRYPGSRSGYRGSGRQSPFRRCDQYDHVDLPG